VVAGEAGVGKTVLLAEIVARQADRARVLLGACDPLMTPRALGPFHDLARQAGGAMARALQGGAREELVGAALDELAAGPPPRVMVVEDAHWADEGTLDLLALLGRRVERTTGALLVTTRTDEIGPALRAALGGIPSSAIRRIDLAPLSPGAVEELARRAGRAPSGLLPPRDRPLEHRGGAVAAPPGRAGAGGPRGPERPPRHRSRPDRAPRAVRRRS
jgi:predicted ATPase